ncbi:hypothetical protein Lal_00001676 [Lupinus albus]|nr:hypothetical protein Lal_00001676 [Lupinus albus]
MYEIDIFNFFLNELKQVLFYKNKSDGWEWKYDKSKQYSVKSAYSSITFSTKESNFSPYPYQQLWKAKAPLKVISFAWRLFQDIIPSKDILLRRGVPLINGGCAFCSFCNAQFESSRHLFFSCSFSYSILQLIYKWLDILVVLPTVTILHFLNHIGMVKVRKSRFAWSSIWLATIWALWQARNDYIFNNIKHSSLQSWMTLW